MILIINNRHKTEILNSIKQGSITDEDMKKLSLDELLFMLDKINKNSSFRSIKSWQWQTLLTDALKWSAIHTKLFNFKEIKSIRKTSELAKEHFLPNRFYINDAFSRVQRKCSDILQTNHFRGLTSRIQNSRAERIPVRETPMPSASSADDSNSPPAYVENASQDPNAVEPPPAYQLPEPSTPPADDYWVYPPDDSQAPTAPVNAYWAPPVDDSNAPPAYVENVSQDPNAVEPPPAYQLPEPSTPPAS